MSQQAEVVEAEVEEQEKPAALPAVIDAPVTDVASLRKAVEFESERIELMQKFVASKMQEKTHYGTIPGTKKPSLWKPGAEVMCGIYRYGARYKTQVTEDYAAIKTFDDYGKDRECKGYYEVRVSCTLYHTISGVEVGEGLGSCNNWEKKYLKQDLFDIKNTILKMAKKRAYIDATLSACRLSDFFTQDLEDMVDHQKDVTPRQKSEEKVRAKIAEDEAIGDDEKAPVAKMKVDFQAHCGGDFNGGTRLMQLMSQLKPNYNQAKGWGAMAGEKWRLPTQRRFESHVKKCKDAKCPEQAEKMFKNMSWVPVD